MTFVTNWPKIVVQLIVLGAVMLNPNALVTIVKKTTKCQERCSGERAEGQSVGGNDACKSRKGKLECTQSASLQISLPQGSWAC